MSVTPRRSFANVQSFLEARASEALQRVPNTDNRKRRQVSDSAVGQCIEANLGWTALAQELQQETKIRRKTLGDAALQIGVKLDKLLDELKHVNPAVEQIII